MRFTEQQLQKLRQLFLEQDPDDLIEFMYHAQSGRASNSITSEEIAKELGWLDPLRCRLTELGWLASDTCREYRFWQDRNKALPFEGRLTLSHFTHKSVLEIGCGMGANLMSMSSTARDVSGVEPVAAYNQLGALLRLREGIAEPDVRIASAEALPFESNRFDIVLCVAAHHYFDICKALREAERVLKPGGELLIVGDTLESEVWLNLKGGWHQPIRLAKHLTISSINTFSYAAFGRRLIPARGNSTTSRPIFPLSRSMRRWLQQAGFVLEEPFFRIGPDTCFSARKPAVSRVVANHKMVASLMNAINAFNRCDARDRVTSSRANCANPDVTGGLRSFAAEA